MADEFDRLLISCPNNGGMFLLSHGVVHRLDDLDTTGVAVSGERLVRALQPDRLVMLGEGHCEIMAP